MSLNRVQKLLLSEYSDFEDLVLIESPFAQTTKDGWGLRQVHLGLTPSKLILATDILPPLNSNLFEIDPNIDPEIETFELIAIYPVECVNLSVYRNKKRQALKARFCNDRVYYFELGGFEKRGMFWNLWCEKVKFLCPGPQGSSSRSETSVATSSTRSTLYLVDKRYVNGNNIRQLWCKFGPNYGVNTKFVNEVVKSNNKWTNKFLFLGKDFQDGPEDYDPIMHKPRTEEFVKVKKRKISQPTEHPSQIHQKNLNFGDSVQVNRFASGVFEGCNTGLYLTVDDYVTPVRYDMAMTSTTLTDSVDWDSVDYEEIAETAVLIWEYFGLRSQRNRLRHRRRYGFASKPLFLYGLGPWHTSNGDEYSLHLNRAASTVNLTLDSGTTLPVTKEQLVASISCPDFTNHDEYNNFINAPKRPLTLFWTPGYRYRPVTAKDAYKEQQNYLKKMRDNHEKYSKMKLKCLGKRHRKFFKKFHKSHKDSENDMDDETVTTDKKKRKSKFISNLLGTNNNKLNEESDLKRPNETLLQHLKRLLKPGNSLTAWDFDSTTLAQQLTLLDKELFLKISSDELSYILRQRSTKNAPNVTAMVAFSYRIGCLIGSEILRGESEKVRARLVARFINVADKCHRLSNFHSCRSVLGGLQSPPIFRLRQTWAYARKKHASKYQVFEYLCRLYRDPRMPTYQKTFFIFAQRPPYLPSIGHIVAKLLNKMPERKIRTSQSRQLSLCASKVSIESNKPPNNNYQENNFFTKLFNLISPSPPLTPAAQTRGAGDEVSPSKRPLKKLRGSRASLQPPNCHVDLLQETTEFLEKCQLGAVNYNFSINQMAREFFLKARHFEDEHNFFNSLSLEDNKSK